MHKTIPGSPARFFLNDALMAEVDQKTLQQVRATMTVPGVEHVCVLPDCHAGYGAPIGSVVVTKDYVLPGPVGYDIGCGMAVYLTNVPASLLKAKSLRRQIIDNVDRGIAMGAGKNATHGFKVNEDTVLEVVNRGAWALVSNEVIPEAWAGRCEQSVHRVGHKPYTKDEIPAKAHRGFLQLGSLGGGK